MAFQPRWWVGYNTSQGVEGVGLLTGGSPSGYESMPSGNATDDALFAAAALKDKAGGTPVTISVENVTWYNVNGPYATQAQANAAIPAINKAHPSQGIGAQAVDVATGSSPTTAVSDPLNYLADVGDFFHRLTEAATWERVGEIAAGIVLLYVGIKAVTQNTAAGGAAKKTHSGFKKVIEAAAVVPK